MDVNNMQYWQDRYLENSTGWDLGVVSPPLKSYFDQLKNKEIRILIPGAGNAYEAEYLHKKGFSQVYVVDWAAKAIENLKGRMPSFPEEHLIVGDFFEIKENFDLVVEQTFFCALIPSLRKAYVDKMHEILAPQGKLIGLLFQIPLNESHPPFGGSKEKYLELFQQKFKIETMETAYNSISPRQGNELFIKLEPQ